MKFRQFALGSAVILALAGCRTDPNIVLLERELRLQEDEIYRLHDCIQDYQVALASARRRASSSSEEPGNGGPPLARPRQDRSGPDYFKPPEPTAEAAEELSQPAPAVPMVPQIELGEPTAPRVAPAWPSTPGPAAGGATGDEDTDAPPPWVPPGEPGPAAPPTDGTPRPINGGTARRGAESSRVARVLINPALSGGIDADGQPGDEGLLVVVEPRDERDRYLAAPADIAVVVLDPTSDSRVARWEYTAAETAELFYDSSFGRGIQLEMGWPDEAPRNRHLHVFVRYTTADGRSLEVDQPIQVQPRGPAMVGWAASPARSRSTVPKNAPAPAPAAARPTPADPPTRPADDGDEPSTPRTAARLQHPGWSPDRR